MKVGKSQFLLKKIYMIDKKNKIQDLIFGEPKQSEEEVIIAPDTHLFQKMIPQELSKKQYKIVKLCAQFVAKNG